MSWLSDFTSKAENLLTKFDQTAAQTLNESGVQDTLQNVTQPAPTTAAPSYERESPVTTASSKEYQNASHLFGGTQSERKSLPTNPASTSTYTPVASVSTTTRPPVLTNKPLQQVSSSATNSPNMSRSSSSSSLKKEEDMLFEFLNSNPPPATAIKGHTRNLSGPKTSTPRRPSATTASTIPVSQTTTTVSTRPEALAIDTVPPPSAKPSISPVNIDTVDAVPVIEKPTTTTQKEPLIHQMNSKDSKDGESRVSSLNLENTLLKNELQSLHEELATLSSKLKEQQKETEKYRTRYENRRNQQNEDYDRVRAGFENREADLNEALKAKDSQLAVLRVRIQETDAELQGKTKSLEDVQKQNEQLLRDHSEASGFQGTVMSNLRQKMEELENELRKEKLENCSMKNELLNVNTKLETEQQQYAVNIKDLHSKQTQGKDKTRELEMRVKVAEDSAENSQKELKEYKDKAARILQAKEKLIASLRQGSDSTSDVSPTLLSELEELRQDRDMVRDELQQNKYKMEQVRQEYLDLDMLHKNDSDDNQDKIETLQSSLQDEVQKRQTAEEDMKRYIQELHFTREEIHSLKKSQISKNQEYEAEVKRLQNQVNVKASSSSSQEELENRIRTLTDSLIHKQTVVEALSTEKNSLNLQLERLEKQYKDIQNSLIKRNKSTDIEDGTGEAKLLPMNTIMPKQITGNVRWRSTVNEIDKFSIRLGVFLRRYPIARLMVIFYMLLLHLWVTFVILTYTPEIHNHDFTPESPK